MTDLTRRQLLTGFAGAVAATTLAPLLLTVPATPAVDASSVVWAPPVPVGPWRGILYNDAGTVLWQGPLDGDPVNGLTLTAELAAGDQLVITPP